MLNIVSYKIVSDFDKGVADVEDILKATLLYDFYGELLTQKQKDVFEYYYFNDYSLTEIGEEFDISRQAVSDLIKRTENLLLGYEKKLMLVKKFDIQKQNVRRIKNLAEKIEKSVSSLAIESAVSEIKAIADEIVD